MKKRVLFGGLILAVAFFVVLAYAAQMPKADATDLYNYITKVSPYQKWALWPGHEAMHPGQSPHGAFLKIYVNKPAHEAIVKKMKVMPDGAIIVKENYAEDKKTLVALTPMYKVKGFDPEAGDWFWAEYGPKGEMMASGKVQACIDCHAKVKATDYLATWSEKK
ncbi:MAG TPA: cytochrome P460 family protein [Candidatus Bathyarchaeia archaeon]|nr:cytochrome P460 family protein [Candidatus Bathyarchaeia archaeon]